MDFVVLDLHLVSVGVLRTTLRTFRLASDFNLPHIRVLGAVVGPRVVPHVNVQLQLIVGVNQEGMEAAAVESPVEVVVAYVRPPRQHPLYDDVTSSGDVHPGLETPIMATRAVTTDVVCMTELRPAATWRTMSTLWRGWPWSFSVTHLLRFTIGGWPPKELLNIGY